MSGPPLGVFTTDERLIVRTWDDWMARATRIPASDALGRALLDVLPDIASRGALALFEQVLAHGTVQVLAPALHHYLFACPPSEPSARFERMQQHVTVGPLRQDGRVVGVIATIEDVTARVAHERDLAEQLRAGGTGPAASGADGPAEQRQIESLTRLLGQDDWRARRAAVTTLAGHGNDVVEALVRTLREQHNSFNVLSSALDLLAVSDIDVVGPLAAFLDDEDVNLRTQAALIMGERRDVRAAPALMAHLHDPDMNVRFHVIEALERVHAVEACDALLDVAAQGDFFLSFPAIRALGKLGNASAAPRLVPLLADPLLRAPVIEALGELGDEDVTVPLVELLNTSDAPPDVIADALAGLYDRYDVRYGAGGHIAALVQRHISPAGMQRLLDAVQRVTSDRLQGLATVLGWLEGEAVQRALTRLLGQGAVRSQVVAALVRHGAGVVDLLAEQLRAEDLETRQAAAVALGRIGDHHATMPLVAALDDPEVAVPAAGALARIGDRRAFEALMARLGDPEPAVRQAVIAALNSIGHPEMPLRIARLLQHADPMVRESAVRVAGYFGYPECVDRFLACCSDAVEGVRRTAVEQAAVFEDARIFNALQAALSGDVAPVRAAAAAALGHSGHPSAAQILTSALGDPDPWVRYAAVRSLGVLGDPGAVPQVVAMLRGDPAPHVRLAAIEVIGRIQPADALCILEPLTQSRNDDIARAAIAAIGNIGDPAGLPLLEQSLRAPEPWRRHAAIEAVMARRDARTPELLQWVAATEETPELADAAIAALARIALRTDGQGGDAARSLVALTMEPARRSSAVAALCGLPPGRVPDVAAGLRHPSAELRRACVEALSRMKHPDASREVESALDDPSAAVRLAAIIELKHLGTRTSHRKLTALARTDADAEVRDAALRAIARAPESGDPSRGGRT